MAYRILALLRSLGQWLPGRRDGFSDRPVLLLFLHGRALAVIGLRLGRLGVVVLLDFTRLLLAAALALLTLALLATLTLLSLDLLLILLLLLLLLLLRVGLGILYGAGLLVFRLFLLRLLLFGRILSLLLSFTLLCMLLVMAAVVTGVGVGGVGPQVPAGGDCDDDARERPVAMSGTGTPTAMIPYVSNFDTYQGKSELASA